MQQPLRGILLGAAAVVATSSIAFAGEQKLEFKLVTKLIEPTTIVEAANVDGQKMLTSKAFGVAFFKDGRVAAKDFIVSSELRNGSGPGRGYSTYTFDDGSSITASFVAEYKNGRAHGTYTILSGTGIYENATGTGSFDNIPSAFKGANLYNGTFDVKTPGKLRARQQGSSAKNRGEHRQAAGAFANLPEEILTHHQRHFPRLRSELCLP